MAWVSLSVDDVRPRLTATEQQPLENIDKTDPGTPLARIIAQVVAEFRTAIKTNPSNRLDPDPTTIPLSCVSAAVSRVVWFFVGRAPGTARVIAEDPRYQAWLKSEELLDAIRTRKAPVESPDDEVITGSAAAKTVITSESRMSRDSFRYL